MFQRCHFNGRLVLVWLLAGWLAVQTHGQERNAINKVTSTDQSVQFTPGSGDGRQVDLSVQGAFQVTNADASVVVATTRSQGKTTFTLTAPGGAGSNSVFAGSQWLALASNGPVPVIAEVNFQSDWEDTGIVQTAAVLHRQGKINLLGVIVTGSASNILTVPACSSLLDYNGAGQTPIGVWTNSQFGNLNLNYNGTYPATYTSGNSSGTGASVNTTILHSAGASAGLTFKQTINSIDQVTAVGSFGGVNAGWAMGDTFTSVDATGTGAVFQVTGVSGGAITSASVINFGAGGIYWPNRVATNYPATTTNVDTAQRLVRRLLAAAKPNSVVWLHEQPATVLYSILTNGNISDEFSTNTTLNLFNSKIGYMCGQWGDYPFGLEYNNFVDPFAASNLLTLVTTPMVELGFSLGGANFNSFVNPSILWMPFGWSNSVPTNSPLKNLMFATSQNGDTGRPAWGTSSLMFVAWGNTYQGKAIWTNISVGGSNTINVNPASPEYGSNYFMAGGGRQNEFYLSGLNTNVLSNLVFQVSYPPNGNDRNPNFDTINIGPVGFGPSGSLGYDPNFFNVPILNGNAAADAVELGDSGKPSMTVYGNRATPPNTTFINGDLTGSSISPANQSYLLQGATGNASFAGTVSNNNNIVSNSVLFNNAGSYYHLTATATGISAPDGIYTGTPPFNGTGYLGMFLNGNSFGNGWAFGWGLNPNYSIGGTNGSLSLNSYLQILNGYPFTNTGMSYLNGGVSAPNLIPALSFKTYATNMAQSTNNQPTIPSGYYAAVYTASGATNEFTQDGRSLTNLGTNLSIIVTNVTGTTGNNSLIMLTNVNPLGVTVLVVSNYVNTAGGGGFTNFNTGTLTLTNATSTNWVSSWGQTNIVAGVTNVCIPGLNQTNASCLPSVSLQAATFSTGATYGFTPGSTGHAFGLIVTNGSSAGSASANIVIAAINFAQPYQFPPVVMGPTCGDTNSVQNLGPRFTEIPHVSTTGFTWAVGNIAVSSQIPGNQVTTNFFVVSGLGQ